MKKYIFFIISLISINIYSTNTKQDKIKSIIKQSILSKYKQKRVMPKNTFKKAFFTLNKKYKFHHKFLSSSIYINKAIPMKSSQASYPLKKDFIKIDKPKQISSYCSCSAKPLPKPNTKPKINPRPKINQKVKTVKKESEDKVESKNNTLKKQLNEIKEKFSSLKLKNLNPDQKKVAEKVKKFFKKINIIVFSQTNRSW